MPRKVEPVKVIASFLAGYSVQTIAHFFHLKDEEVERHVREYMERKGKD